MSSWGEVILPPGALFEQT